jgi:hypothetical protein
MMLAVPLTVLTNLEQPFRAPIIQLERTNMIMTLVCTIIQTEIIAMGRRVQL